MNFTDAILTVALVAGLTFLTRFLPFALFGRQGRPSAALADLNTLLPAAIIAVLVVYCLKAINFSRLETFLPQLIAVAIVAALHVWKRNNLLSIGVGTACYMFMVQVIWPA